MRFIETITFVASLASLNVGTPNIFVDITGPSLDIFAVTSTLKSYFLQLLNMLQLIQNNMLIPVI